MISFIKKMFGVKDNVKAKRTAHWSSKYNFHTMKIGDSFKFSVENYNKVASASCYYGKRHHMKFQIRVNVCRRVK